MNKINHINEKVFLINNKINKTETPIYFKNIESKNVI